MRIRNRVEVCDSRLPGGRLPSIARAGSTRLNVLWIEPSSRCNLECVHCYAGSGMNGRDELAVDDWVDVLVQGAEVGCRIVQIAGGEPTLFPGLACLVEKAREIGYRYVVLFTNATCLSGSDLDEFRAYNVELVTSFYSHLSHVHESITQRQGSFERTVDGIRSIIDKGLALEVSMVRMAQNAGSVQETVEFLTDLGVRRDKIAVGPVRAAGRALGNQESPNSYARLCGRCDARHLVVSSDGSAYPCILARWCPVGDVRSERLRDILSKRELTEFRSKARRPPERALGSPSRYTPHR